MKQNKKWSMRIASFCLAGACLCGGAVLAAGEMSPTPWSPSAISPRQSPPISSSRWTSRRPSGRVSCWLSSIPPSRTIRWQWRAAGASGGDQCLLLRGHSHLRADAGHGGGMRGDAAGGHRHPGGQHGPGADRRKHRGTLNNGGALTANHLYMATIADRTVRPPPPPSSCWCGESTPSPETGAQTEGPACLFDMPGPFLI